MPWQILVKQSKTADVTSGGLFMPADSTEKPSEGTVVLAGPGTTHPETGKMIPNPCKEGDLVLLSEYVGEKVDYCGDKHSFVSASEVLGIFEGGAPVVGNFKPLQDRVLVKLTESATETASGIALASETTEEPTQGEVLAVGEGLITSQAPPPPPPPPHHRRLPTATPHRHLHQQQRQSTASHQWQPRHQPHQQHHSSRATAVSTPPSCCRATWCRRASSRAIRSSTASTRARWSTSGARSTRSSPLPTAWPSGELAEYVLVRTAAQRRIGARSHAGTRAV